jgi:hypothetical protein
MQTSGDARFKARPGSDVAKVVASVRSQERPNDNRLRGCKLAKFPQKIAGIDVNSMIAKARLKGPGVKRDRGKILHSGNKPYLPG